MTQEDKSLQATLTQAEADAFLERFYAPRKKEEPTQDDRRAAVLAEIAAHPAALRGETAQTEVTEEYTTHEKRHDLARVTVDDSTNDGCEQNVLSLTRHYVRHQVGHRGDLEYSPFRFVDEELSMTRGIKEDWRGTDFHYYEADENDNERDWGSGWGSEHRHLFRDELDEVYD